MCLCACVRAYVSPSLLVWRCGGSVCNTRVWIHTHNHTQTCTCFFNTCTYIYEISHVDVHIPYVHMRACLWIFSCVSVCVYMLEYVTYMSLSLYIYIYVYDIDLFMCLCVYSRIYVYIYIYLHTQYDSYICIYIYMYVYIYMNIYTCIYIYTYLYMYIIV